MDLLSIVSPWLQALGGAGAVVAILMLAVRIVSWASQVTTLLGNHLRHDLADQTEEIRSLKKTTESLVDASATQTELLREVVREIRALRGDFHPQTDLTPKPARRRAKTAAA